MHVFSSYYVLRHISNNICLMAIRARFLRNPYVRLRISRVVEIKIGASNFVKTFRK